MSPTRLSRVYFALAVSFTILISVWSASWADNENETVGFKPNHIFASGAFGENIDVLNGGLNLSVPIGFQYPVSANLSYQVHLNYSSRTWDTVSYAFLGQVYPGRRGPAGFGFSMNFGRFYRDIQRAPADHGQQNVYAWKWISPDGTEHEFGTFADAAPGGGAGYRSPKQSTYDGSDCSVTLPVGFSSWNGISSPAPVIKVSCPDKLEYTFEHMVQMFDGPGTTDPFNAAQPTTANDPLDGMRRRYNQDFGGWYVTLIEDRRSALVTVNRPGHPLHGRSLRAGWVYIEYDVRAGYEHVIQRITDSVVVNGVGREIVFTNTCLEAGGTCAVESWDLDPAKPRLSVRTTAVTIPAFGGSTSMTPSTTATYTFEYSRDTVKNLLHTATQDPYPHDTTETMLKAVNFPATTTPIGPSLSSSPYQIAFGYDQYGELESRTLPTGARIGYMWEGYAWGSANPGYFGMAGGAVEGFTQAVTVRTLDLDPTTVGNDGEWRYIRDAQGGLSNPRSVTVKDIAGNETVYSFHASPKTNRPETLADGPTDGYAPEWNDGLIYRKQYYQGSGAARTLLRTTTQSYEASQGDGIGMPDRWDIRVKRETTRFDDDNGHVRSVENYEYLRGGLFKLRKETGDGIPQPRWTRTQYFDSDPSVYDFQEVYDGDHLYSRRDVQHSAIDATSAQRVLKEIDRLSVPGAPGTGSNLVSGAGDITAEYTYDSLGNVTEKRVSTGDPATEYRSKFGYTANGQLATKEFYDRGASNLFQNLFPWKAIDLIRDANTGLIIESRDTAGIATQFVYDALGRLITITPLGGERPTEIIYDHQVDGSGNVTLRRTVVRQGLHADMGTNTSCAPSSGDYLMTCYEYDSLGRISRTEHRPESTTASTPYQFKKYDTLDRVTFESKWLTAVETCDPAAPPVNCGTLYDYHDPIHPTQTDPFDRVRRIRTADGKETKTRYFGLSSEVTVQDVQGVNAQGQSMLFNATTTYYRDVWGRLVYVDVPPGGGSDAAYAYDARDNLIAAQMEDAPTQTIQNRTFEYDALNRLRSSWNPESGGSTVVQFDPLGNVLEKRDSTGNRIISAFDGAGRLTSVARRPYELPTSVDPVEIVHNTYDQVDSGGHLFGASAGRLTKTESFDDDHVPTITRELRYNTGTGRLVEDRSYFPGWSPTATLKYSYNGFGLVSRIDYPEGPAGKGGAFAVGYGYSNGYLTQMNDAIAVSTMFGTASYNAAGGFKEIATMGGVKTAITPDEMFRTKSITVTRVSPQTTHLATGDYVYDGVGNIASIGTSPADRSTYAYDAANRLVRADIWNGATNRVQAFTYDDFGNMVEKKMTVTSGTATQDLFGRTGINRTLDHMVFLNGGTTPVSQNLFDYDARGNLIRSDSLIHQYDARDRMVAVRGVAADFVARYSYDASSYRVQKEERSRDLRIYYVRDGSGRLMSEFRRTRIGTYDPEWTKHYLYFGDRLLGLRENTRPSPPGRLTATTTLGGSVTISWLANPASENVNSYKVYRASAYGTPQWTQVCATVNLTCTNAATPDSLYKYQVTAVNASGEGYGSDITLQAGDDMLPSQPTGVAARAGDRRIDLTWDANDAGEYVVGYYVYAGPPTMTGGPTCLTGVRVTPTPITTTSYAELNLGVGARRCYWVTAVDSVGQESPLSAHGYAVAGDYAPPASPAAVSAVVDCLSTSGPVVSWNPIAIYEGVDRYVVYRTPEFTSGCSQGFESPCGKNVQTALTYTDSTAVAGQTYRYEVVALDASGNASLASSPGVTLARNLGGLPQPKPPLVTFAGDGRVVIAFGPAGVSAPTGSSYKLYRKRNTELDCAMFVKVADGTAFEDLGVENGVAYDYAYRIESSTALSAFSRPALAIPVARPSGVRECMEEISPTSNNVIPEGSAVGQFGEDHYRRLVMRWQENDPVSYQPHLADGGVGAISYLKGHRLYAYDLPTNDDQVDDRATLATIPVDALKNICVDPSDVPGGNPECTFAPSNHSPVTGTCFNTTIPCMQDSDCANGNCSPVPSDPALVMYGDGRVYTSAIRGGDECLMVSSVHKVYANGNWLTVESPLGGEFDVSQLDPWARCIGIPAVTSWNDELSSNPQGSGYVRDAYACLSPSTRPPVPAAPSVTSDAPGEIKVSWTEPPPGMCELTSPEFTSPEACKPIGADPGGCNNPALVCSSADAWTCRLVSPQQCTTDGDCTLPTGLAQHCVTRSAGEITGYRVYAAQNGSSRYHFQRPLPAARVARDVREFTFKGLASHDNEIGSGVQEFRFRVATETSNGEVSEASPASGAIAADSAPGAPEPPASLKTILWTANDALHPQELDGIKLDWKQHLTGGTFAGYRVWRSETPEGTYCSLVQLGTTGDPNPPEVGTVCLNETTGQRGDPGAASVSITTTGFLASYYVDRTVLQGRTWYYKVSAVRSDGTESAKSLAVAGSIRPHESQPLSPPSYFKAMAPEGTGEHQGVYLRWCPNPTAEQVDGYRIYRRRVVGNWNLLADNVPPVCLAGGTRCEIRCPGGGTSCELGVLTQTTSCTTGLDGTCKVIDLTMPVPIGDRLEERNSHTYEYVVTALHNGEESAYSVPNQGWPKYWTDAGDDPEKHRFDPDNFPDTPCGEESSALLPPEGMPGDAGQQETILAKIGGITAIIQNPNEGGGGGGYSPPNASVRFVFFHLDHLGNIRIVTDASGALISAHNYLPFGEEAPLIAQGSSSKRQFAGHERDDENGADLMLTRYYDASLGRFLSSDPGGLVQPRKPQSWNQFSYVQNRPMSFVDPDGRFPVVVAWMAVAAVAYLTFDAVKNEAQQAVAEGDKARQAEADLDPDAWIEARQKGVGHVKEATRISTEYYLNHATSGAQYPEFPITSEPGMSIRRWIGTLRSLNKLRGNLDTIWKHFVGDISIEETIVGSSHFDHETGNWIPDPGVDREVRIIGGKGLDWQVGTYGHTTNQLIDNFRARGYSVYVDGLECP